MAQPVIEPVTDATLPELARFLHEHLSNTRSAAEWERSLRTDWPGARPNFGFVLRDAGSIVGGIGAYYADRQIGGRVEKICNITSWCVLDRYRQQSMRLAMAVINQKGYHFTDFSPTKVVSGTLQFFKFKPLDERQLVVLNSPWPGLRSVRLLQAPAQIAEALDGDALAVYRDHARYPWLRHLLVGRDGRWCHVIYKRRTFKRLPAAAVLHVSDRALFAECFRRLSAHWFLRGYVTMHVECRFMEARPWPSRIRTGFNAKLYLSATLRPENIDYLYSESMALDL